MTPRDIAEVDFYDSYLSDQVLFDYAEVAIGRIITESVDAVAGILGMSTPPFNVTVTNHGGRAEKIMIKPDDGFIWDVVAPRATAAGVGITATMVLPTKTGEPQITFNVSTGETE